MQQLQLKLLLEQGVTKNEVAPTVCAVHLDVDGKLKNCEMTHGLARTLQVLGMMNGRTSRELCSALGISYATLKRYIKDLRECGVEARASSVDNRWSVSNYGVVDVSKLRRLRLKVCNHS